MLGSFQSWAALDLYYLVTLGVRHLIVDKGLDPLSTHFTIEWSRPIQAFNSKFPEELYQ